MNYLNLSQKENMFSVSLVAQNNQFNDITVGFGRFCN